MNSKIENQVKSNISNILHQDLSAKLIDVYDYFFLKDLQETLPSTLYKKLMLNKLTTTKKTSKGEIHHLTPSSVNSLCGLTEVMYSTSPIQKGDIKINYTEYGATINTQIGGEKLFFSVPYSLIETQSEYTLKRKLIQAKNEFQTNLQAKITREAKNEYVKYHAHTIVFDRKTPNLLEKTLALLSPTQIKTYDIIQDNFFQCKEILGQMTLYLDDNQVTAKVEFNYYADQYEGYKNATFTKQLE